MKSSSLETINIAAITRRLDVDHKISLRFYYRIADNILRQADIFRRENSIIDLYVMLLRFSSLVSETIPCHRDYRASHQSQKIYLKKKLLIAVNELEKLKPAVQQKIEELNRRESWKLNGKGQNFSSNTIEFTPAKRQLLTGLGESKAVRPSAQWFSYQVPNQQFSYTKPVEDQIRRLTLSLPRPKEESLAKHSIFGLNGLNGQSRPPTSDRRVRYPSEIDLTPVEIPSLHQDFGKGLPANKNSNNSEHERSNLELGPAQKNDSPARLADDSCSLISFEAEEASVDPPQSDLIRQPSPPPVLSQVQELIPECSPNVADVDKMDSCLPDDIARAEEPLQLHISTNVMEAFMRLAESNTTKNLETCGVLAGLLKNRKFYVTALIIPKQESTSDSCQTTNEEEIFEVQDKQSLFPLGWIHTHPTQSCFMSSIDVHTHYSYQIMLPEAIAIVMAPQDGSRKHGIFRLTAPGGMTVIRQCQQRGFHPHSQPPDGSPIYKTCTDIYMDPTLNFDIIDLR